MTPLNVRRFYSLGFFAVFGLAAVFAVRAQTAPPAAPPQQAAPTTSGDVMRERISKSKAFIAVRNYNAAIYELENIRKETGDPAVQAVVNVLLMNSYLEQGDYKRAQDLLTEFHNLQKKRPAASPSYMAVAGQAIKGARSRVERYKALGLSVSDRTLPLEALNDLEKMRETLELVITQAKEAGADKSKSSDAMMMLEEASSSRSMLARDDYDSRRWKDEVADTREKMVSSQSVVLSALNEPATDPNAGTIAAATKTAEPNPPVVIPVSQTITKPVSPDAPPTGESIPAATREREVKIVEKAPTETVAKTEPPVYVPSPQPVVIVKDQAVKEDPVTIEPKADAKAVETPAVVEPKPEEAKAEEPKDTSPMDVGQTLISYATSQAKPVYPAAAKVIRATGVVKVEVTIDESGDVAEVQKASGPSLLQAAAMDAIRKWKFRPFVRDGMPVKAIGWVNFNFTL